MTVTSSDGTIEIVGPVSSATEITAGDDEVQAILEDVDDDDIESIGDGTNENYDDGEPQDFDDLDDDEGYF